MSAIEPCPKCELPLDLHDPRNLTHMETCIGPTPYVVHNREYGMVVYLSEEEWTEMQAANQAGDPDGFSAITAAEIANRAVFGITP